MKILEFENFNLLVVDRTENDCVVIWKKTINNEDIKYLDEAINIVNSKKDCILHYKDDNDLVKEMAQLKIHHFPNEDIKLRFSNTKEAYVHVASQLI